MSDKEETKHGCRCVTSWIVALSAIVGLITIFSGILLYLRKKESSR